MAVLKIASTESPAVSTTRPRARMYSAGILRAPCPERRLSPHRPWPSAANSPLRRPPVWLPIWGGVRPGPWPILRATRGARQSAVESRAAAGGNWVSAKFDREHGAIASERGECLRTGATAPAPQRQKLTTIQIASDLTITSILIVFLTGHRHAGWPADAGNQPVAALDTVAVA